MFGDDAHHGIAFTHEALRGRVVENGRLLDVLDDAAEGLEERIAAREAFAPVDAPLLDGVGAGEMLPARMTVDAEFRFRIELRNPFLDRERTFAEDAQEFFVAFAAGEFIGLPHVGETVLHVVDADEAARRDRAVSSADGHLLEHQHVRSGLLRGNRRGAARAAETDDDDVAGAVPLVAVGALHFKRLGHAGRAGKRGRGPRLQESTTIES